MSDIILKGKTSMIYTYNTLVKYAALKSGLNLGFLLIKNPETQNYLGSCRTQIPDMREDRSKKIPIEVSHYIDIFRSEIAKIFKETNPDCIDTFIGKCNETSVYEIAYQSDDFLNEAAKIVGRVRGRQDYKTRDLVGRFGAKYDIGSESLFVDTSKGSNITELYRELTRLLCTQTKDVEGKRSGFCIPQFQKNPLGYGLQKGYLEWFTQKHFNKIGFIAEDSVEYHAARLLELIVGEDKMQDMFVKSDLKGLVKEISKYCENNNPIVSAEDEALRIIGKFDDFAKGERASLTGNNGYELYYELATLFATKEYLRTGNMDNSIFFSRVTGFIAQVPHLHDHPVVNEQRKEELYLEVRKNLEGRYMQPEGRQYN